MFLSLVKKCDPKILENRTQEFYFKRDDGERPLRVARNLKLYGKPQITVTVVTLSADMEIPLYTKKLLENLH